MPSPTITLAGEAVAVLDAPPHLDIDNTVEPGRRFVVIDIALDDPIPTGPVTITAAHPSSEVN